jgi:hypothetical protein
VLLTFASGRRRAKIAALNVEDLAFGFGPARLPHRDDRDEQGRSG